MASGDQSAFDRSVEAVRGGAGPEVQADALLALLTDDEKLWLLDGDTEFYAGMAEMNAGYNTRPYHHGTVDRLGIPGTRFVDGPRGCVAGAGTAFPVSMSRGATWDVDLEQRVGEAIGREVRAQGGNFFGGVCINLPRHPAWGRAQETYGDDSYHLGEMGAALARGTQRYVMACAKHYALNSMENARFQVDVTCDEATLHDVYLAHFERCADEGVAAIMTAYNSVNGEWAGQNPELLEGVLRDQWQWPGITVSDFVFGLRDAAKSLTAGLDIEEPVRQQRATHLRAALDDGRASWDHVDRACRRILASQLRSYATREADDPGADVMASDTHRALAREVATRSMVLLRNEPVDGMPVLPLAADVASVALIGRLAVEGNMGDMGSSAVRPPTLATPADGLRAALPDTVVTVTTDDDPAAAAAAAVAAEVAVVVAGFTAAEEGEFIDAAMMGTPEIMAMFPPFPDGFDLAALADSAAADSTTGDATQGDTSHGASIGGDRASLRLRPVDEEIIAAVVAANPRTVVVLVAAGAVMAEAWRTRVPATLLMGYAGMEGGHALADVLIGRANPSGRLPYSVPTSEEHLPYFDRDATSITYDRWHGQRLLDRLGVAAAYPHGFGLSYTTFVIGDAAIVATTPESVQLRVGVANTGDRDGHHVVQVYGRRSTGSYAGELLLCGFAVVDVPAGERREVAVDASLVALAEWDPTTQRRVPPALDAVTFEVGAFAHDPAAVVVRGDSA